MRKTQVLTILTLTLIAIVGCTSPTEEEDLDSATNNGDGSSDSDISSDPDSSSDSVSDADTIEDACALSPEELDEREIVITFDDDQFAELGFSCEDGPIDFTCSGDDVPQPNCDQDSEAPLVGRPVFVVNQKHAFELGKLDVRLGDEISIMLPVIDDNPRIQCGHINTDLFLACEPELGQSGGGPAAFRTEGHCERLEVEGVPFLGELVIDVTDACHHTTTIRGRVDLK